MQMVERKAQQKVKMKNAPTIPMMVVTKVLTKAPTKAPKLVSTKVGRMAQPMV